MALDQRNQPDADGLLVFVSENNEIYRGGVGNLTKKAEIFSVQNPHIMNNRFPNS
jgi:hypothetical protein